MNTKSICLNMIVKNESHVIQNTLQNILDNIPITYYVISDTGSSDNTIEIIKTFFKNKNINGEIYNDEWKDFGYNRTLALKHAYGKTDYLFIFDADDKIIGDFKMINDLMLDTYYFKFGTGCGYKRILLINNNLEWKYVGVLHEFLALVDNKIQHTTGNIDGNYYVDSGKTGSRSNDPEKYKKDAIILEKAHDEAVLNNDNLKVRYSFYCAQSFRDSNQKEKAIEWYKKRIQYKDWEQEVYFSYFSIGKLYMDLRESEKAIYYWSLAYNVDDRYECLFEIISYFRQLGRYDLAFQYFKMIKKRNISFDKLFLLTDVYNYLLDYELTFICSHIMEYKVGLDSFHKLFINNNINISLQLNILNNFIFYIDKLQFDLTLLESFCIFIKNIYFKIINLNVNISSNIKNIIDKFTSHFSSIKNNILKDNILKLSKNKDDNQKNKQFKPKIVLTITTCKRLDLFTKTVDSLLTCWKDIDKIDYFICIDDNSTNEDRKAMIHKYPFFKYILKKNNEKGHLSSMNIIWDKLNDLKPDFWIHLEDDWLFFKPDNYVQKSIDFLHKYKDLNIHQILFNKGYGEVIDDYNLVGGKMLDNDNTFYLHIKDEPDINGRSSSYWPHYSFRPSMVRVDIILKLGNFNSSNTFFERAYADKYFEKGYLSAFFNEITSIHTGRLTSERDNPNIKNAYQLNNIDQFTPSKEVSSTIKFTKINEKYFYLESFDHFGDDILFIPHLSIEKMMEKCEEVEDIICFNNIGYFKNHVNLSGLMNFNDNTKGLYVNIERLQKKYGINIVYK